MTATDTKKARKHLYEVRRGQKRKLGDPAVEEYLKRHPQTGRARLLKEFPALTEATCKRYCAEFKKTLDPDGAVAQQSSLAAGPMAEVAAALVRVAPDEAWRNDVVMLSNRIHGRSQMTGRRVLIARGGLRGESQKTRDAHFRQWMRGCLTDPAEARAFDVQVQQWLSELVGADGGGGEVAPAVVGAAVGASAELG